MEASELFVVGENPHTEISPSSLMQKLPEMAEFTVRHPLATQEKHSLFGGQPFVK